MKIAALCLAAACLLSTTANAALESRLGGLTVYDTDLNITWLADANLAASNTFGSGGIGANGIMTWATSRWSWIDAINANNYLGHNDWRLTSTLQPDASCASQTDGGAQLGNQSYGYNCTGSEMGHLFSELGGLAGQSITTTHNASYGLFQNIQSSTYWSGSEYQPRTDFAWDFRFADGYQVADDKRANCYVMVVRDGGQVAAVPVPGAAWFLGSGLLCLVGFARKHKAV